MLQPISNASRLYPWLSHWWHSVLVLIVDDIFFCNIPNILIRSSASNSPRAVHSSLRLPCLWEQPKSATDIELITTAHILGRHGHLLLRRVAGYLNPECDLVLTMSHWRYAVAIQNLRNWSQKIIFSLTRQFMVSLKLMKCSKSKI